MFWLFKNTCCLLFTCSLLAAASCQSRYADSAKMVINLYDERNYKEVSRGSYHELEFVITYQNIYEPSYYIRWVYPDSTYSDSSLMSFKYFYHNDVMDGPKESFTFGKLRARGFLKENKRHGAQVYINEDGYITKWEYYKDGKKSGVWESCNSEWRMYKKVYYDDNGQFVKQEIYDRRTGKLFRTEYEESRGY